MRRASYPSMENISKLKTLNEGMEPEGLMDTVEEYSGPQKNIKYGELKLTKN